MSAHTPGPWFVDPSHLVDVRADGTEIASAFQRDNVGAAWEIKGPITVDIDTAAANARLIAAAPELLEALMFARSEIWRLLDVRGMTPKAISEWPDIQRADAAIAKATGSAA